MIGVIIQARTGSKRFPRKIYEDLNGKCTLHRVLEGVCKAKVPNVIVLAMPDYDKEEYYKHDKMVDDKRVVEFFGDPDDLVDRYFNAARNNNIDLIVRVTADCPMVQGQIIDEMLIEYLKNNYNGFMGNNELISTKNYPDGVDVEIFPYWMLAETIKVTQDPYHREHVTPYMYRKDTKYNIYRFQNCEPNTVINTRFKNFSFDTDEDYRLLLEMTKNYDETNDINDAIEKTWISQNS